MNLNGITAAIAATGDALNAAELREAQLTHENAQLAQENDRLRARLAAVEAVSEPEPDPQEQTAATDSAVPPAST